jgi:hypothetical protein
MLGKKSKEKIKPLKDVLWVNLKVDLIVFLIFLGMDQIHLFVLVLRLINTGMLVVKWTLKNHQIL